MITGLVNLAVDVSALAELSFEHQANLTEHPRVIQLRQ